MWENITEKDKNEFNNVVTHPLQSYEWGNFREKTGIEVIRKGFFVNKKLINAFQLTLHKIPHTPWTIGYLPKGDLPGDNMTEELRILGKKHHTIFIQLEPGILDTEVARDTMHQQGYISSTHPLFTRYTFQLDLTKSEDDLLKNMHPKTRYNIRVAQKHNVEITEENTPEAFEIYWQLTKETTTRQHFYAHTQKYHTLMWDTLQTSSIKGKGGSSDQLQAHLFIARYRPETGNQRPIPLAAWVLFSFHDTLYYPYGASSSEYRNVMASNLLMWEAIRFGIKLGLKKFDMWGSLGENPDTHDPWYGFHRLKQGYGPTLIKFVGSYDLIINPILYAGYVCADKLRWMLLKIKK